jgi:single-stranded DNA-specific DHH superfamily exonuclease
MLPKNPAQWERIDRFLMSFSPKEKIAIVHDYDPDGLSSAVIMNRLIERLRGRPVDAHFTPPHGSKNTIAPEVFKELRRKKADKVIFTDLGIHEDAAAVKKLEKQCEILIIDHHRFFRDISSERTALAMPQLLADDIEPSRYASSKIAYDLANRHAGLEDSDWIAAIGTISDMAGSAWPDFLAQVFAKHQLRPNPKDWFKSDLGSVSGMLFAAMAIDERNVKYCFDVLMKTAKPQDVLKDKKLASLRKVFDKEINAWVAQASKRMEKHDNLKLIWYEISPKYHINSPVATILSLKPQYQDWAILIIEKEKGVAGCSGRCQSQRVPMNVLLKDATKGLKDAAGGGHVPAAGAHMRTQDLGVFKQRILDALSKNLYTPKEKQTTKR